MKKKFLSLMMAAAVVATTSVSAFADEVVKQDGGTVNVKITGSVNDKHNKAPEGTISVTVPTALAFTVDSSNSLKGSSLTITNNGTEKVDVFAYEFVDKDSTPTGIEVKKTLEDSDNRTKVKLNLSGNAGVANFTSTITSTEPKGIYGSTTAPITDDGVKIATVGKVGDTKNTEDLTLDGEAGKGSGEVEKAIREEFTLRLKIKKAS